MSRRLKSLASLASLLFITVLVFTLLVGLDFNSKHMSKHVPSSQLARFINEQPSSKAEANSTENILIVNLNLGPMPDHFPAFMRRLEQNPTLSFLLIATFDSPELCPREGRSKLFKHAHHQVYCAELKDMMEDIAKALCDAWQCNKDQFQRVVHRVKALDHGYNYHANTLKPIIPLAFGHLFDSMFPQQFSHWFRIDTDVRLGSWEELFPVSALEYDIIGFSYGESFLWTEIWLKGCLTGFRHEWRVARQALQMELYKSPDAFDYLIKAHLPSADEGDQSVAFYRDARPEDQISWIVLPGLLMADYDLRPGTAVAMLHRHIMHVPRAWTRSQVEEFIHHTPGLAQDLTGFRVGSVRLTQENCALPWIGYNLHICLAQPEEGTWQRGILQDKAFQVQLTKVGSDKDNITATIFPRRPPQQGQHLLAYHFQDLKNYMKGDVFGKPDELMMLYFDKPGGYGVRKVD
jgi:hypothetical protein